LARMRTARCSCSPRSLSSSSTRRRSSPCATRVSTTVLALRSRSYAPSPISPSCEGAPLTSTTASSCRRRRSTVRVKDSP
jgi:hypothetical protein